MQPISIRRSSPRALRAIAGGLFVALVAACSAAVPPPHLYVLTAVTPPAPGAHSTEGLTKVMVAQAQVPDFLDRPQLIEHIGANGLKLVESDQWAERLSMNVSRVVAQNISAMVPADASIPLPVHGALPYDYQVVISLNDFELDQSGQAVLAGRWSITDADGNKELAARSVSLRKKANGAGIPAAVEAMSVALGEVSRDIAEQIKALSAKGGAK